MSTKHLKPIVFISLGVIFLLVLCVQTQTPARPKRRTAARQQVQSGQISDLDTLRQFQNSAFYRMIIDNNLFRSLGWRPPRPKEPYLLLGTLIPTSGKSKAQAIVQHIPSGTTHTLATGGTLDTNTTLVDIQPKQITLSTNGQHRTLRLSILY